MSDPALELMQRAFGLARAGAESLLALVEAGVPVNARNQAGDTFLMLASYHGHAGLVAGLLARGADPELANDRGQTPLQGAAFKGDVEVARALLDGGAAVDSAGGGGETPLAWARLFQRDRLAALLLERGADPGRVPALARLAGATGVPALLAPRAP
jgi:uncharacterized protein